MDNNQPNSNKLLDKFPQKALDCLANYEYRETDIDFGEPQNLARFICSYNAYIRNNRALRRMLDKMDLIDLQIGAPTTKQLKSFRRTVMNFRARMPGNYFTGGSVMIKKNNNSPYLRFWGVPFINSINEKLNENVITKDIPKSDAHYATIPFPETSTRLRELFLEDLAKHWPDLDDIFALEEVDKESLEHVEVHWCTPDGSAPLFHQYLFWRPEANTYPPGIDYPLISSGILIDTLKQIPDSKTEALVAGELADIVLP